MMNAVPALELNNLTLGYGNKPVAAIASLVVQRNEVIGIVGRSGSGKSTILNAVSGTLVPLNGTIAIDGIPCNAKTRNRLTARTLQNFPLLHWLTVRENLELSSRIRGKNGLDPLGTLTKFRAGHLIDRFPNSLSGGERCRASLAQAIVTNPRILLLDEPFTGLDTLVKKDVADTLFKFAQQERAAVLFVTHDLDDACHYAERICVLTGKSTSVLGGVVDPKDPKASEKVYNLLATEMI